jgi:hypothetical protein
VLLAIVDYSSTGATYQDAMRYASTKKKKDAAFKDPYK